ncbi:MAG: hypothetical protein ACI837_001023 [Crocinitomicaceae bacterium]|jgi:hypothetical protein
MKSILLFAVLISSYYGIGQEIESKTIRIEPHMSFQNYEHFKRLVLKSDFPEAEFIDGFTFEWGYAYELNVKVEKLKAELSDGTRYDFTLINEISRTKVPAETTFKLFLEADLYYSGDEESVSNFKQINDSTYLYFDEIQIIVPTELASDFQKIVASETFKIGLFTFIDKNNILLTKLL